MDEGSPRAFTTLDGETGQTMPVSHLAVSGLVVSEAAQGPKGTPALRHIEPQRIDSTPLDGEQFLLMLAGADQGPQIGTE